MSNRVVVVGAGVVGLTCGVRLAEAGIPTDVIAADLPSETTSAVAGAVFWPTRLAGPDLTRWVRTGLREYTDQVGQDVGVALREGLLLTDGADVPVPGWASLLEDVGVPAPERVSENFGPLTGSLRVSVPVIDPPRYLAWLTDRFEAAGGSITRMAVPGLPERGTVVNATGHRAKWLAKDDAVVPVRGVVVLVRNPGIEQFWIHDAPSRLHYAIPRSADVVTVGGSYEENELLASVDTARGREILAAAAEIDPRLRDATLLSTRVGFRPHREPPRVELETGTDRRIVHCYGHGGSGWALAWGTADDVLGLLGQSQLF